MKKTILLFSLCLSLTSCAKYTVSSIRNSNITIDELRGMQYTVDNTSIKYNDQKSRPFAAEENDFMLALNKGMEKNFYKKLQLDNGNTMNLSIKITTNDKHEIIPHCSKTNSSNYGYYNPLKISHWLFGIGGISAGSSKTTACQESNTYYDVIITGVKHTEDGNDVLFETKLNYKSDMVNAKDRSKELKNMINKATQYIGTNMADRVGR